MRRTAVTGTRCHGPHAVCVRATVRMHRAPFCRFDLAHYLDGQPMQFMMRPRGDKARPYFAFEMWHEKLLAAAQRHHS